MASIWPPRQRAGLGQWILPGGTGSWLGTPRSRWYADQRGICLKRPIWAGVHLPDEHAAVLADENSPAVLARAFPVFRSLYATEDGPISACRPVEGGGNEHSNSLYRGTARRLTTRRG